MNTINAPFDTMGPKRKRIDTTPVPSPTQLHSASGSTPEPTTSTHDPIPAMANVASLKLRCFIKGDSIPFRVTPAGEAEIDDLKDLVWERKKNGVLRDTDASDLVLWQVSSERPANSSQLTSYSWLKIPVSIDPLESLAARIASLELEHFAINLDCGFHTVLDAFRKELPALCVHIVVEHCHVGEPTS